MRNVQIRVKIVLLAVTLDDHHISHHPTRLALFDGVADVSDKQQVMSDREAQLEEIEVLQSIYADECEVTHSTESDEEAAQTSATATLLIHLAPFLTVECTMPHDYPSQSPPSIRILMDKDDDDDDDQGSSNDQPANGRDSDSASSNDHSALLSELRSLWQDQAPKEAVLFQCLELIKERIVEPETERREKRAAEQAQRRKEREEREEAARLAAEAAAQEKEQQISTYDDSDNGTSSSSSSCPPRYHIPAFPPDAMWPAIITGPPMTDRKSTFQAHFARVYSVRDTQMVLAALYQHTKIQRAAHNMWAYVLVDGVSGIVRRENDDDGEDQAGSRLTHLLHLMGVKNMMVVVSRWFGGILLGADRFKHINNVAREIIEANMASELESQSKKGGPSSSSSKEKKAGHQHRHKR